MGEVFSPLYREFTCPESSVVRLDELFVRVVLSLNLAGTTFAAESLASKVITQAATIMKPVVISLIKKNLFEAHSSAYHQIP